MTQKKDDKYYIVKIIESCEEIIKYTNTKSKEEFLLNVPIQGMTCFMFIQISENAKFLSNDFINKHNEISWDQIRGLRNRVVHDYGSTDLDIIYETSINDVVFLYETIKKEL